MILALVLAVAQVVTVALCLHTLREKDRHHALQISGLLNRIQAPEVTVAQELTKDEDFEPVVLPHTPASYWAEVEHIPAEDAA